MRQEIYRTLEGFADACNQILAVAKKEKCYNTTKLHHKVYKPVRAATGLKANHVCQAIRRVVGNSKATKQVHIFRPTSISLDARTFKYVEDGQTVGITLKSRRVKFKLSVGAYQIALLRGQSLTSATLSKTRPKDYYINFVVEVDTPPTGKTPKVIGVDLGRRFLAVTTDVQNKTQFFSGSETIHKANQYQRVRKTLQRKGTRSATRRLKLVSGRQRRFTADVNHKISKYVVTPNTLFGLEDLTHIRERTKPKRKGKKVSKKQRKANTTAS